MLAKDFNPWKNIDEFNPMQFVDKSSELAQWPIKLWKAPIVSPYYHHAHLLIAADCSAFAFPGFHNMYGYVVDDHIQHIGCGVEIYMTVPAEQIEIIYRNHLMLHPTELTAQPWGDLAFEIRIGGYQFMIAAG